MTVDLICETIDCDATGQHLVTMRGRRRWLCGTCRAEILALAYPPAVPWQERLVTWGVFAVAFGLWAVGILMLATGLELNAGLGWLRWMPVVVGLALGIWWAVVVLDRTAARR